MLFGRKRQEAVEVIEEYSKDDLKEYIPVDNIKAHLVNMLEENRRLREEKERLEKRMGEEVKKAKEKEELSLVAADEYKKRQQEAERESAKLKKELSKVGAERDEYRQKYNDSRVAEELTKKKLEEERKRQAGDEVAGERILEFTKENSDLNKLTKAKLIEGIEWAAGWSQEGTE